MKSQQIRLEFRGVPIHFIVQHMIDDPIFLKQTQEALGWRDVKVSSWSLGSDGNAQFLERWNSYMVPLAVPDALQRMFNIDGMMEASSVSRMTHTKDNQGLISQVQVITDVFIKNAMLSPLESKVIMNVARSMDGQSSLVHATINCDFRRWIPMVTSAIESQSMIFASAQINYFLKEVEKRIQVAGYSLNVVDITSSS